MRPIVMGLAVLQPGLFSTVQDQGRNGTRGFGVPVGGSFDGGSADLANALLGNPADAAVIELTLTGGHYEARSPLALALAGAPMATRLRTRDGQERTLKIPACFPLVEGDQLLVGGTAQGARTYLAVGGGWKTPPVLGSRSSEVPIAAGFVLPCESGWSPVRYPDSSVNSFSTAEDAPLRMIDGPDSQQIDRRWLDEDRVFRVGLECNRMGIRLEGPAPAGIFDPDRVSTPVAPGTVQVAGGTLLVLGIACGTMGGYPHVGQVISADLDRLAQARPGERLRLVRVSLSVARSLDRDARRERAERRARLATAASDEIQARVNDASGQGVHAV